jgi:drug/metabolite transporter (DMT)-like permease
MTAVRERPRERARLRFPWQAQFALIAAIWGSSFLSIKVLDRHLPPIDVGFGRIALGTLTLLAVLAWRRERLPSDPRVWRHLAIAGLFWNALPFTLFAYGETRVSSILAGLWNATAPLLTLVAALVAFRDTERPTRARIVGLAVGFAGVVIVLAPWRSASGGALLGQLACFAAALSYGVIFPYTRRHLSDRPESPLALTAGQLLCANAGLALLVPFAGTPHLRLGADGVAALLTLGVLGTGVAVALMHGIIRVAGATTAAMVPYPITVVATAIGVLVLGEPLHANEPLGAAVVLFGIAISQNRLRRA